jgi:glycosyltransferase involved in cell wall biosynthesis
MKILMVIYMFPPVTGGGEQGAFELAKNLVKLGHEVHVATTGFDGLKPYEEMAGIKVHRLLKNPFLGTYKNPQRKNKIASSLAMLYFMKGMQLPLIKLASKESFDIINAQFILPAGLPAVIAAKLTDTILVTSLVGGDLYTPGEPRFMTGFRNIIRPVYDYIFKHSHLTAISTDTAQRARDLGCKDEIAITPYGIDVSKFRRGKIDEKLIKEYGLTGKIVLLSVCRLSKRKGLSYLIRALPQLSKDTKLLLVGDGVERNSLESLATELDVRNKVVFAGSMPNAELPRYYSIADIFVLPSLHEGMGIVFLEAMSSGLPVVTTNRGGQVDFVRDGQTGLLVEPKSIDKLRSALQKLIGDDGLRKKLSKNAEELMHSEYTWEKAANRYLKVFENSAK